MGTELLYPPEFVSTYAFHARRNSHTCRKTETKRKINESTKNTESINMFPCEVRNATGATNHDYAGSAFSVSPSPRALPLPSFSSRRKNEGFVNHSATRDLRRLLRLE